MRKNYNGCSKVHLLKTTSCFKFHGFKTNEVNHGVGQEACQKVLGRFVDCPCTDTETETDTMECNTQECREFSINHFL